MRINKIKLIARHAREQGEGITHVRDGRYIHTIDTRADSDTHTVHTFDELPISTAPDINDYLLSVLKGCLSGGLGAAQ